jgi:hypothetical protein
MLLFDLQPCAIPFSKQAIPFSKHTGHAKGQISSTLTANERFQKRMHTACLTLIAAGIIFNFFRKFSHFSQSSIKPRLEVCKS